MSLSNINAFIDSEKLCLSAVHGIACCTTVTLLLSLSVMSRYQRINWINSGLDATYQQQAPWHGTTDTGH